MQSPKYFLKVEIAVKEGQMGFFMKDTVELVSKVQDAMGWKLVAALSGVTGIPNLVVQIWSIPSADALLGGMNYFASDPTLSLYTDLLKRCDSQKQEIFTAMPYNPAPLGANPHEHARFLNALGGPPLAPRQAISLANINVYVGPDSTNPAGTLYAVTPDVYTNPTYALGDDAASIPLSLLSGGATVANIPKGTTGIGGMCYLVNLPGLQLSAPGAASTPQLTPRQLAIVIKGMLASSTAAVPGTRDMDIADALARVAGAVTVKDTDDDQNLIVYVNPDPNDPTNPEGGLYSIPPSVYAQTKAADTGGASYLLLEGTVVALMPAGTPPGGYLLNLPGLTPSDVALAKRPKRTASQVLGSVKALLAHTEVAAEGSKDGPILEAVQTLMTKYS